MTLENGLGVYGGEARPLAPGEPPRIPLPPTRAGGPLVADAVRGLYSAAELAAGKNETGWALWAGTSFAAPVITGLAADLWAEHPELSPREVIEWLRHHAALLGPPGDPDGPLDAATIVANQEWVPGPGRPVAGGYTAGPDDPGRRLSPRLWRPPWTPDSRPGRPCTSSPTPTGTGSGTSPSSASGCAWSRWWTTCWTCSKRATTSAASTWTGRRWCWRTTSRMRPGNARPPGGPDRLRADPGGPVVRPPGRVPDQRRGARAQPARGGAGGAPLRGADGRGLPPRPLRAHLPDAPAPARRRAGQRHPLAGALRGAGGAAERADLGGPGREPGAVPAPPGAQRLQQRQRPAPQPGPGLRPGGCPAPGPGRRLPHRRTCC